MASIIRIKRSGVTAVPEAGLASGELAYSWATAAGGKLYIGSGVEDTPGVANSVVAVGGLYYTDLVTNRISHAPGTLTANSAIIVNGQSVIDHIKVDNLDLNDSTLSSISLDSNIIIDPNGAGKTVISNIYVDNDTTSLSAYIEQVAGGSIIAGAGLLSTPGTGPEEGSTVLSVRVDNSTIEIKGAGDDILQVKDGGITNAKLQYSSISVAVDGVGTPGTVSLGGTLSILGSGAINTELSGSTVTVSVDTATTSTLGVAKFASADFGVSVAGEVTLSTAVVKSITTDSVGGALVSTTNAISILGGTAIGVTHTGSTITVAGKLATTSTVGVASFNTGEFTVSGAGEVAINAGGIGNNKLANSAITLGTTLLTLGNTGATAVKELAGLEKLNVDNIQIDNNDITSTTGNINITALAGNDVNITATGLGNIDLSVGAGQEITVSTLAVTDLTTLAITNGLVVAGAAGALQTSADITFDGTTLSLNGDLDITDGISISGNTISSGLANANIVLAPNGTGTIDASTAKITNLGAPEAGTDAATKTYVDTIASSAIHYHDPVRVESPDPLPGTYDNGTAGVGATLTGTNSVLVIDGITVALNDRVLIYTQGRDVPANAVQNGIYYVSQLGVAGTTPWILTRSTDTDTYEPSSSTDLGRGDSFYVKEGNTGAGELYVMTTTGEIIFGDTPINFSQISSAQIYKAGDGILLNNVTFSAKVDDSSIGINSSTKAIEVKLLGITDGLIANDTITNGKLVNSKIVIKDQNAVTDDISLGDTLTFTVGTGTGITTAVTANTVTISGINASETVKGVASFNATHFTVDAGAVSLDVEGVQDIVLTAIEATADTGISVNYNDEPDNKLVIAGIDATVSVKGVAKFGGWTNSANNVRQFSVTDGDVTIVSIDGGSF